MSEEDEARRQEERRAKGEEGKGAGARQHRQPGQQQDQGWDKESLLRIGNPY